MVFKEIRWGILGTGWISERFADDLKLVPGALLYAVASRNLVKAQKFAESRQIPCAYGSYSELVNDPNVDVVYIATPHIRHKEDCILCLEAGKAILCEKPFAINSREAQVVVDLAREKQLFCMEAMWMRFLPMAQHMQKIIKLGEIGDICELNADFGYPTKFDPSNRFFDLNLGGGSLLDRGIYPISLAFFLMGKPSQIFGLSHLGVTKVDEQAAIILGYEKGQLALLSSTLRHYASNTATITGTRGKICIHQPFCKPEKISITRFPENSFVSDVQENGFLGKQKEKLKYLLKKNKLIRNLILDKSYGKKEVLSVIVEGNGYSYQAAEVVRCLNEGELESSVMPLDETVEILKLTDSLRSSWGLKYPGE